MKTVLPGWQKNINRKVLTMSRLWRVVFKAGYRQASLSWIKKFYL